MDNKPIINDDEGNLASIAALANDPAKSVATAEEANTLQIEGANIEGSMHEAVQKHLDAASDPDDAESPTAEKKVETAGNPSDKKEDKVTDKPAEEEVEEGAQQDDKFEAEVEKRLNERFDQHPRFQELQTKVKTLEPLAENARLDAQYCEQNRILPEQKKQAMELVAKLNSKPDEALVELEALVHQIKLATGKLLPDDLAKEVQEGTMSQARAQELHMARMTLAQREQQATVQQQTAAQQHEASIKNAINISATVIAKKDADFKPKAKETDRDGVYELTQDFMKVEAMKAYPQNESEAVSLLERAYARAKAVYTPPQPQRARRTLRTTDISSSGVSNTDEPRPGETMQQFMARTVGKKYGIPAESL